jgi:hypothetical protein
MNHWIETRSVLDAVSSLSDHCLTQGAATPMDDVHGGQAFSAINGYLPLCEWMRGLTWAPFTAS